MKNDTFYVRAQLLKICTLLYFNSNTVLIEKVILSKYAIERLLKFRSGFIHRRGRYFTLESHLNTES